MVRPNAGPGDWTPFGTVPFQDDHAEKRFKEVVGIKEYFRLIGGDRKEWMNDSGIGFYLEMLNRRNDQMRATKGYKGPLLNSYFFPINFYDRIYADKKKYDFMRANGKDRQKRTEEEEKNKDPMTGIYLPEKEQRGDVFERDLAFMIVNKGGWHWTLVVVNFIDKRIEYFDGFGTSGDTYVNHLRRWLKDEKVRLTDGAEEWDDNDWTYHQWTPGVRGAPAQADGWNCGVIALQTANYYAQDGALDLVDADWPVMREMMVAEMIESRLYHGEGWPELPGLSAESEQSQESQESQVDSEPPLPAPPTLGASKPTVEEYLKGPGNAAPAPAPAKKWFKSKPIPMSSDSDNGDDDDGILGDQPADAEMEETQPPDAPDSPKSAMEEEPATQPQEHDREEAMTDMAATIAVAESYYEHISSLVKGSEWAQTLAALQALQKENKYDGRLLDRLKALNVEILEEYKKILTRNMQTTGPRARRQRKPDDDYPDNSAPQLDSKKKPKTGK